MNQYGTCEYHPERNAVAMCKRCKVTVCSECLRVYEYQIDPVNTKKENLCPECYKYKTQNDYMIRIFVYIAAVVGLIFIIFYDLLH